MTPRPSDQGDPAMQARLRQAYEAYLEGHLQPILDLIAPDVEWTYLDPGSRDPQPQVCHGRAQVEAALRTRLAGGLHTNLEHLAQQGQHVLVILHTPGLDARRARQGDDRNFEVLTVRAARITAIRACRDRTEALDMFRSSV